MNRRNIILIGFMGSGKTSVGEQIADQTGRSMIDTDRMIEEKTGLTISRIFELEGEEAFRRMETELLEELLSQTDETIISVGGGLPMKEKNRGLLKKLGMVIYLNVRMETVRKRLEGDGTRPLLKSEPVEEKVNSLLAFRDPIYQSAAHMVVVVDGKTVGQVADEILQSIGKECDWV